MTLERKQVDPKEVHNAAFTEFVEGIRNLRVAKAKVRESISDFNNLKDQVNQAAFKANEAGLNWAEQELLKRGFAVCDDTEAHRIWNPKGKKIYTAQELGLFPMEKMRMRYSRRFWYTKRPEFNADEWGKEEKVELICPSHFPENSDRREESKSPKADGEKDIYSEVVADEDKFRRTLDGFDVTLITLARLSDTHLRHYLNKKRIMDFLGAPPHYELPPDLERASL